MAEVTLIDGVNDGAEHAENLSQDTSMMNVRVSEEAAKAPAPTYRAGAADVDDAPDAASGDEEEDGTRAPRTLEDDDS